MKRNLKLCLAGLLLSSVIFSSCGSTKTAGNEGDSYSEGGSVTVAAPEKKTKASGSFWTSFFGRDKYTEIDDFYINTVTAVMTLKKQEGVFVIHNKAKTVGFGSPYLAAYYYVTFDDASRAKMKLLLDNYLSDFENKKLDRRDNKSYKAYGTVNVRLDWGTLKASTPNYTNTKAYIGYKFKEGSPYFTITIFSTINEKYLNGDEGAPSESVNLDYYMTKAQASNLIEHLSEDYLKQFVAELSQSNLESLEVESDEY